MTTRGSELCERMWTTTTGVPGVTEDWVPKGKPENERDCSPEEPRGKTLPLKDVDKYGMYVVYLGLNPS